MRRLLSSFLVVLVCISPSATATDNPMTVKLLTEQLAALKTQITEFKKNVEEVQITNNEIFKIRDTFDEVYSEYDELVNMDSGELQSLLNQYKELTNLTKLKDADSFREKYYLLHEEISKRFRREGLKPGGDVQKELHKTVVELNTVDEELARVEKQLKVVRADKSDAMRVATEAQLMVARASLEDKKQMLEARRAREATFSSQLDWDSDFAKYLAGTKGQGTTGISDNFLIKLITFIINPQYVYEAMEYLSGFGSAFLLFWVFFLTFRMLNEGMVVIGGKASIGHVFLDAVRSIQGYVVYIVGGALLFTSMFAFYEYFDNQVGVAKIHSNLLDLRKEMVTEESTDDFAMQVMGYVLDWANLLNAGLTWILYQVVSPCYVLLSRVIDLIFAVSVALAWVIGFLAIATHVLPKKYDLTPGWITSIYTVFLWGVCEFLLVGIMAFVTYGASVWLKSNYSSIGSGVTASAMWYVYSCMIMILVLLLRIAAPFVAVKLASQQSFVSAMGAIPAALGAMIGNQIAAKAMQTETVPPGTNGSAIPNRLGMLPDASGDRTRDSLARGMEKLSQIANAPLADVGRSAKEAMSKPFGKSNEGIGGAAEAMGSTQNEAGENAPASQGASLGGATAAPHDTATTPANGTSAGINSVAPAANVAPTPGANAGVSNAQASQVATSANMNQPPDLDDENAAFDVMSTYEAYSRESS